MSAETPSWKTGALHASVRRRAIVLRIEVSGTVSTSPAGSAEGAVDAAAGAAAPEAARSTSSARIRPSGPVPWSDARSTPRSRAMRRASGDALRRAGAAAVRRVGGRGRGSGSRLGCGNRRFGAVGRRILGRRLALSLCRGLCRGLRRCPGGSVRLDHGHRRAHLDVALGHDDLGQHAVELGLHLLRDLVGVELVERLSLRDGLALGLEPAHDDAGLHALAEARKLDVGRHQRSPRGSTTRGGAACGSPPTRITGSLC